MMQANRRELVAALAVLGLTPAAAARVAAQGSTGGLKLGAPEPFSWAGLQSRAEALARQPYRAQAKVAAAEAIGYDAVGTIRYRDDRTLLGGIRLFPLAGTRPRRSASISSRTVRPAPSPSPPRFSPPKRVTRRRWVSPGSAR